MQKEKRSTAKVHYELGGCARSTEAWRKCGRNESTKKISEVSCLHCLKVIKREGLIDRDQFPEIPTFKAKLKRALACFRCPVCGQENVHGRGAGHRVAHCDCWERGYFIEV
ncbi:MAG: hypothetical protein FP812_20900 [Desulfobacula sp.]|nr:hypothetical protein [Desulfobacula sp.]